MLRVDLAKEKKAREEAKNEHEKTYGRDIGELADFIAKENSERVASHRTLMATLAEMVTKFHTRLDEERDEREQTQ